MSSSIAKADLPQQLPAHLLTPHPFPLSSPCSLSAEHSRGNYTGLFLCPSELASARFGPASSSSSSSSKPSLQKVTQKNAGPPTRTTQGLHPFSRHSSQRDWLKKSFPKTGRLCWSWQFPGNFCWGPFLCWNKILTAFYYSAACTELKENKNLQTIWRKHGLIGVGSSRYAYMLIRKRLN